MEFSMDANLRSIDELYNLHSKLICVSPSPDDILQLCSRLSPNQGRSSQRLTNALQNCDVNELDKPWPGEEHVINIGNCCSFAPHDTDDLDRLLQKLTLFPSNFMQRLRILKEKARSPAQFKYAFLISNIPYALYLVLFQKIAKEEAVQIVKLAHEGSPPCQLILTIPNLTRWDEWGTILREWTREEVNKEKLSDDTDILNRLLTRSTDRYDIRSLVGNNHLHSFLSDKVQVLMHRNTLGCNWLSFTGTEYTCQTSKVDNSISTWKYGSVSSYTATEENMIEFCMQISIGTNIRRRHSLPARFPLSQLKALTETMLENNNVPPCNIALFVGFPSCKIDASDDTLLSELDLNGQVIAVRQGI